MKRNIDIDISGLGYSSDTLISILCLNDVKKRRYCTVKKI